MTRHDVVIAGAGPAGCAAAAWLARSGRDVLLVDPATFPRDKTCGDGLTALALRELEHLGLDPRRVPSWTNVDGAVLHSPGGRRIEAALPMGRGVYAAITPRAELDAALVDLVRDSGATVRTGVGVSALRSGAGQVRSTLSDCTEVQARFVIAADGMWSPVRKMLGLTPPRYRGEWHAFRQYVRNVGPDARRLHVFFERDLAPGYFWSFPLPNGRANIGFGIVRRDATPTGSMGALWRNLLERPRIREVLGDDVEPDEPHRALPIPARLGRLPLAHGRVLFVGDAVGATDPMSGEGIGQALQTGRFASEAIVSAGPFAPLEAAAAYRGAVREELLTDHRFAELLSGWIARPAVTEMTLALIDANGWTRRNFARWMFEDYPRALVGTPRRWRRSMFAMPGAFSSTGHETPG